MLEALLAIGLYFSSAGALAAVPFVRCQLIDKDGREDTTLTPLYPVRKSSLHRVKQDRFIDLKYNAFRSSVAVTMLEMPHAPWTFGETVIGRDTLQIGLLPVSKTRS
jgi:hypothetical protein